MGNLTPQQFPDRPKPRVEVQKLHGYTAPLEGRRNLLRLDFNENTLGPSPLVIEAIRNIPSNHISIYPEYNGLREGLIANLISSKSCADLSTDQIGIFNGVDAAIHAIFHAYGNPSDQLVTTTPTFGYYTPCAHMQGMEILAIPYAGVEMSFPFQKIKDAVKTNKPKLLLICNPNNPTGTRLEPQRILELAALSPHTLVVVDELYEAFTGDSVLPKVDLNKVQNLLILRSLSKTAGLAGLRIGFAIGNSDIIENISRVTGPYDINSFAVIAALAALKDQAYVDAYVQEVLQAKDWVKHQLIKRKVHHHMAGGNYFLLWPKNKSSDVEESLRAAGILVRDMKGKSFIEGALRVSIGTTKQMNYFWDSFSSIDLTT